MTEAELSAKPASFNLLTATYGGFDSYALLTAEVRRAHRLRLDLCKTLNFDPDVTTDGAILDAVALGVFDREVLHKSAPPAPRPADTTAAADSYTTFDDPAVVPVSESERKDA